MNYEGKAGKKKQQKIINYEFVIILLLYDFARVFACNTFHEVHMFKISSYFSNRFSLPQFNKKL
jgi:hypothetical protein